MYYSENNFYLLLSGKSSGLWDPFHTHHSSRMSQFNRFTRMAKYFERSETPPTDQSLLRHIKNIVVHVTIVVQGLGGIVYGAFMDIQSPWLSYILGYSNICIRGEKQRITCICDFSTEEHPFDPTDYHWTVMDVGYLTEHNACTVEDAYDLLEMSFTGRTQPIEGAIEFLNEEQQSARRDRTWRNIDGG